MSQTKKVETVLASPPQHWVGDGFPVSSVISPQTVRSRLSPYVLMDYAGPAHFEPADEPRGVDTHPHRGFETVTIVYQGEVEHRDSAGNSGKIGPGDVQWMTAAAGVLHEEKHSRAFTRSGGTFEAAQLWVNLPAKDKKLPPHYQTLTHAAIPVIQLPEGAGSVRVIAGTYDDTKGAAMTYTPVILWDIHLAAGAKVRLPLGQNLNAGVYIRSGAATFAGTTKVAARQLAVIEKNGDGLLVETDADADLIVVGGEAINEPVVAYGPFVMNKAEEIQDAINDLRAGKFGVLE